MTALAIVWSLIWTVISIIPYLLISGHLWVEFLKDPALIALHYTDDSLEELALPSGFL